MRQREKHTWWTKKCFNYMNWFKWKKKKLCKLMKHNAMAKYYNFWRINSAVEYWWIPIQFVWCDQLIESWPLMRYLCHGRTCLRAVPCMCWHLNQIECQPEIDADCCELRKITSKFPFNANENAGSCDMISYVRPFCHFA